MSADTRNACEIFGMHGACGSATKAGMLHSCGVEGDLDEVACLVHIVAPASYDLGEVMTTLRFASGVKSRAFAVLGGAMLVTVATAASAREDGGLQGFFAHAFGLDSPQQSAAPNWYDQDQDDRPLVVTPHRHRTTIRPPKIAKGPITPVSIYEDTTLRRGDAVMTAHGIRIFRGSRTLPYLDTDFVAIADSNVSRDVAKALNAVDRLPRS